MKTPEHSQKTYSIDEVLQQKHWSNEAAFRYCERLTKKHYENFPVGSLLIPKKLRPAVWSIYAFARRADDIADEDFTENERIPALNAWESLLIQSQSQRTRHPVFIALRETMLQHDLPIQLFQDLLTAFRMDVQTKRHARFQDLLFYCQHSANPVGRLILLLFGYRDEKLMELSDKICTALQLTNFWQDVAVDLKKGRIYLPLEDMERFHYSEDELLERRFSPEFQKLLQFQVERCYIMFQEGAQLTQFLKGRLKLEIKCVVMGGIAILKKIQALQYNTLEQRPQIVTKDKVKLLLRAMLAFKRSLADPWRSDSLKEVHE